MSNKLEGYVVVVAVDGTRYVGKFYSLTWSSIQEAMKHDGQVKLYDVFELSLLKVGANVGTPSQPGMMEMRTYSVQPVDMEGDALPWISVAVSSWYPVSEALGNRLYSLIENTKKAMQEERARESGIALPGPGMSLPMGNPGLRGLPKR
jgi:hypothetical protein